VEKTKPVYVFKKLANRISTTSFDLCMSKGANDIFYFVINFIRFDWQPKQMTIGMFEATKTSN